MHNGHEESGTRAAVPKSLARRAALLVLVVSFSTIVAGPAVAQPADVTPPTANAGPDQTADEDTLVAFDGSGSTDDVGIVNYTWTFPGSAGEVRSLITLPYGGPMAQFDPIRPLLYVLGDRNVSVVNLTTGAVDRVFAITHEPRYAMSLAVAPRGTYMAVGIPTGERGYYFFGPYQSYVATFDLVNQTPIGEFFVDEDVSRTLVTDDGYVIVAGGSGQWATLRMLNARNGTLSPQAATIWQYSSIALHPSQTRLYSVDDTGIYPPGVHRFDFVTGTGITGGFYWPYHGTYPGTPLWVDEGLILTGDGYLLASRANASEDMRSAGNLFYSGIGSAAFDSSLGLIAVSTGTVVSFFDRTDFTPLGTREFQTGVTAMRFRGQELLVLAGGVVSLVAPRIFQYGALTSHAFAVPGSFGVTLTVWDAAGHSDSDVANVTVRDITPPVANAGPDQSVSEGSVVAFDASASSDNVGIAGYTWTFVDGTLQTLVGINVSYRFANVGVFVVTLTVSDATGRTGTDTAAVTVNRDSTPPVADAGPNQTGYRGSLITFDGSRSTDSSGIANLTWTFTDGSLRTLYGVRPSHRFLTAGTYVVTLTVRDFRSNAATDILNVFILDFSLTEYERPAGFRVGIPSDWDVRLDTYHPALGPVDLIARDRILGQAMIIVFSRAGQVQTTDEFLLATARLELESLRAQHGPNIVVREPEVIPTNRARAAVFEVNLSGFVRQVWAVFANARYGRIVFVVGSSDAGFFGSYRPVFDSVIASPELLVPADPGQTMGLVLVAMLGLTIGPLVGILAFLSFRARKSQSATPRAGTSGMTPGTGLSGSDPARQPVLPPGTTTGHAFCPRCGFHSPRGYFCVRCGLRLR